MKKRVIKPERAALIALSKKAKVTQEHHLATTGEHLSINQILLANYQQECNQSEFKTFKEWKDAGFIVNQGEKSFRVWASPKKAPVKADDNEPAQTENEFEFYPMCCLFHAGQVSKFH